MGNENDFLQEYDWEDVMRSLTGYVLIYQSIGKGDPEC